ncbi:phenylalanyl-tRNA synthetase [Secundilactobacillus oryzae JCM 18671]|uniref:Phenylalanyl-tRNA synthetase n=1 Tax=Secundilactobacillus oryzae JCM 18671 TaxID=1291743 RepID=A0A081BI39_9LACO|nr:hypothetical protein [Secundilactobacillus oryzae]GAK47707.1 phenylalanyl-tRNA synthetase [Secundilactobacillus oryzae JCM 18671]
MAEEKVTEEKTEKKDFTKVPLKERTEVKDIDDKTRQYLVTETDGTTINVNVTMPNLRVAESIDDTRSQVVVTDDGNAIQATSSRFHQALFGLFSAVVVDNKPAGKIDWDFFDKHEIATFRWLMNEAATFFDSKFNAD